MRIKDKKEKSPFKTCITPADVAALLNDMNRLDSKATYALLIKAQVPCNKAICDHPTIQVIPDMNGQTGQLTLLGFLNGLFGINKNGFGCLQANADASGIKSFEVSENFKDKQKIPI